MQTHLMLVVILKHKPIRKDSGVPGVSGVPDVSGVSGVPGVSDVPDVSGVLGVPDVSGVSGVPDPVRDLRPHSSRV